ncbi:hypothetical protein E9531_16555 [Lampropedia puyangensis]|uniref:Transglycosylase SLT domain-containing protein n=1 Tax=Lampropedia puyangensis TaxID=1330072 RepID=A0A4S8ES77_9BURK|nr:hypothetical protein [Lampropedia puyangensis]THT96193.1 hypothetical protein E9531_16555 [Lampropedia puyangensis]
MALLISGCSTPPPRHPENVCSIFEQYPQWHSAALATQAHWGAPVHVPMAIMYQESSFRADAQPPKAYVLGIIPWGRVSSAYGYSQALNDTWNQYKKETGKSFVKRNDFADSMDFIGWYMSKSRQINGISLWDAYGQYLNYHEGWTGYRNQSYRTKTWLPPVATKVANRAQVYAQQYAQCKNNLPKRGWLW